MSRHSGVGIKWISISMAIVVTIVLGSTNVPLAAGASGGESQLFETLFDAGTASSILDQRGNRVVRQSRSKGRRDPFRPLLRRSTQHMSPAISAKEPSVFPTQKWTVLGIMRTVHGRKRAVVDLGNAPPVILSLGERVEPTQWRVKEIAREALVLERPDGGLVRLPVGETRSVAP